MAQARDVRPWFSLSSHKTYSPGEEVQIHLSYQGIEHLDFRIYRVSDPIKFFEQLKELHSFGPETRPQPQPKKVLIESLYTLKKNLYLKVRNYFRTQLSFNTRKVVLHTFTGRGARKREPAKGAKFAMAPLLNQAQLVQRWEEPLAPRGDPYSYYNSSYLPLDLKEKGVYLIEAVNGNLRAYTIVIITEAALITKSASGQMLVLAVDRSSGKPMENYDIRVYSDRKFLSAGRTDASGLYSIKHGGIQNALSLGGNDSNFAVSDLQGYFFQQADEWRLYIYTDRPVYRPGHKVYFKGILRRLSGGGEYSLNLPDSLEVEVRDAEDKSIYKENLKLSEYGTFDGELTISEAASLGFYSIIAFIKDQQLRGGFKVEEYKKPEYEIKVSTNKKFYVQGETIVAEIAARYYFGEPVANATVKYYVYASRYYRWFYEEETADLYSENGDDESGAYEGFIPYDNMQILEEEGNLDADGKLMVEIPTQMENKNADLNYRIVASVTDAARRELSGSTTVKVTRGDFFINITTDKYVYKPQETAQISIHTITFEGKPVSVPVELEFNRTSWSSGKWSEQLINRASAQTAENGKGAYSHPISEPGYFKIRAIARDRSGNTITAEHYLYVFGYNFDSYYVWQSQQIELIPDQKSYRVGDIAHLLVLFPSNDIYTLATVEGRQIHHYQLIKISGRSTTLDIPIRREYAGNCFVNIAFVKDNQLYTHSKFLNVVMDEHFLEVEVTANKNEYKPQEKGEFNIAVKDKNGNPVRAELSVGVVDESIYAIQPETARDIRKAFYYPERWNRVYTQFSAPYYFSGYSSKQAMQLAAQKPTSALADFKSEGQTEMAEAKVRKFFPDTLFWKARLRTDAGGQAKISLQYPDSLTTWRATIRAVTRDTKIGSAVSKTLTRKNLILQLQTPRFFTERDEVTVSTTVHNYLSSAKMAKVSLEVNGAQLLDGTEKSLMISQRGESRLDWRLKASSVGEVRLLGKALTDEESDAVEITIPTIPYGLGITIGRSGHIAKPEETIVEKITIPANSNEQTKSLRLDLSPSLASTLVSALDYLTSYPYGCVEQTMSSFLPNITVTQAVQELKLNALKSAQELPIKVRKGLERLYRFQHEDGGWGWWEADETHPFMTAYVVAGLVDAKNAGYDVDDNVIRRGIESLKEQIENGGKNKNLTPDIKSYMIYALAASGSLERSSIEQIKKVYDARKELNNLGLALLALALRIQDKPRALTVVEDLEKRATVTNYDCYWESKRQPMLDFYEDNTLEATAFSVKALSNLKPESPVIGKAVRWLVNHRKFGYYWDSTKQTAIVIYSLIDYLKITKELQPNYRLKLFLNNTLIKEQSITEREVRNPAGISLAIGRDQLLNGNNEVKIIKSGNGNLYYSLLAKYYTTDEKISPQGSEQLKVEKSYFKLRPEKQRDRIVYKEEPLAGPVVSGDTILVKLKLSGENSQYMLIEDPIPAGCEPVEQDELYEFGSTQRRDWRDYDRRELRDQKVVFFKTYFYNGQHELYYILKAQVPGDYNIMPTQVELMYQPEYRANSENYFLRVE